MRPKCRGRFKVALIRAARPDPRLAASFNFDFNLYLAAALLALPWHKGRGLEKSIIRLSLGGIEHYYKLRTHECKTPREGGESKWGCGVQRSATSVNSGSDGQVEDHATGEGGKESDIKQMSISWSP
ncbi:hypothetical protein M404DRAFT_991852 [Pisolithus tinctorius Marx 270]|uniref:Uncharacterized protein n=1 Tax=Pisolithus tinctorius Marx 270 TaxID=870435 RepID=A0A0C3PLH0_PISTI|nr:hypothetical protein M404DRAFT_991852 [Pisolithus tinctorius Marx 270]